MKYIYIYVISYFNSVTHRQNITALSLHGNDMDIPVWVHCVSHIMGNDSQNERS